MFLRLAPLAVALLCLPLLAEEEGVYDDPAKVDDDFVLQGEYSGKVGEEKVGVQVIALGKGKFQAIGHTGGLPGDGATGEKVQVDGELKGGTVVFKTDDGAGTLDKMGKITITDENGGFVTTFEKVERKSETLEKKPPEDAVVLFDGKSADEFENGKMTPDGLLMQGVTSKQKFDSFMLHIEFRLPYMPHARGQARGNSGIYLQGRYEVQMLDSFGLEGKDNECGGIYSIADPKVNMCYPPLSWQTYDIDYTAAKFDSKGKKTQDAVITVKHNGVTIHENLTLPKSTTASPLGEGPEPGPIYLQDHGNPVRYRNIWLVPKKS